jgi:hypothetical protein
MPIILATNEAEIRRIVVRSQLGQIVCEILSREKPSQKRAGGAAQGVSPEFKPQYCKKQQHQQKQPNKQKTILGHIVRPCIKNQIK